MQHSTCQYAEYKYLKSDVLKKRTDYKIRLKSTNIKLREVMLQLDFHEQALEYHALHRPGKIEVLPTKAATTQKDLSLAYSPGVAIPCLKIAANKEDVYKYTAKGNLIAVISNGTAVLGLGDIGPEASKPVMEGKSLLFKICADIDAFDLELDTTDVEEFVRTVKILAPTFGGINLEDIKAPECFEIEKRLQAELDIPVMHDDQHGTAIVSAAALLNACELQNKQLHEIKMVVNGAGAAAIACCSLYTKLGIKKQNIIMLDRKGVIRKDRTILEENKKEFATLQQLTSLEEALVGADVFIGLSSAEILTPAMLLSMADNPIVFAMANPNPEINYELAINTRQDAIVATGRSDYPNQVNNVLCFPYIFRGAIDVLSNTINEEMKIAAVIAIAALAKEPITEEVRNAYGTSKIGFGKFYILPKPTDKRLLPVVASAVARAAIKSGAAKKVIDDWNQYTTKLEGRLKERSI